MAEQLAAIEALPEQFGGIAAGFRHATIGLARESAKWIRLSILPTNTFFQGSTLETRLYITRTNNKLLFGFIRRPGETAVIMDATVNLRFEIAEREFRGTPVSPESVLHTAIVPSFFQAAVSADQVLKVAKVLGSNPEEIFFIQLDAGVLAVVRPDDFQRARWPGSAGPAMPGRSPYSPRVPVRRPGESGRSRRFWRCRARLDCGSSAASMPESQRPYSLYRHRTIPPPRGPPCTCCASLPRCGSRWSIEFKPGWGTRGAQFSTCSFPARIPGCRI